MSPHHTKVMGTGGSTQVTKTIYFNTQFYCDQVAIICRQLTPFPVQFIKKCPTSLIQLKPLYKVYQHQLSYHYWRRNFRAYTEIRQQQLNRRQMDNIQLQSDNQTAQHWHQFSCRFFVPHFPKFCWIFSSREIKKAKRCYFL